MASLFNSPRSLLEQRLDEYFTPKEPSAIDHFMRAVSIVLYSGADNKDLVTLFKVLPLEQFIRVVTAFNGRTVNFGKREALQESLMLATLYYYKEVEGMSWEEIQTMFTDEINTIGYGSKIKNLTRLMRSKLNEALVEFKKIDEREQKRKKVTT